jgi:ribosomal protein L11 methyltransferase
MPQTRLLFQAAGPQATEAFQRLEQSLEDEGVPIAIWEVDEDTDIHEVSIYVLDDVEALRERVSGILAELPFPLELTETDVPDIDWVTHSLEGLHAVRAGRFFVHGSHDRDKIRTGDLPIQIDAGLAFGTGHHGTTSGCLEMIARVLTRETPRNALDLGTGSAVLAIAIAKLRRIPVLATDIDPIAVQVARDNVVLNKVSAWVETATAAGFHNPIFGKRRPFGLIVANILARPLMKLAPDMARHIEPDGSLILSGILERQRNAVVAAYVGQGFRHVTTLHREGWVTIHMKR